MESLKYDNNVAIATVSLGMHPSHSLTEKIVAASRNHFSGIEVVYSDLEAWCRTQSLSLLSGARAIKAFCNTQNIEILSLAPFKNFEAHSTPISTRLAAVTHWLEIAQALGATYLQVPSQFDTENSIDDEGLAVKELQELADLANNFGVSIAYEAVAWGQFVATWQDSLEIVKKVERANFGLCWDAFHVLARIWGDCTVTSGKIEGGDEALKESLDEFVTVLKGKDAEKIFYVQLSDGEFYDPPLKLGHKFWVEGMDSRLAWSRNTRPFPLEEELGGYFPVGDVARAVLEEGEFKGWVSFEIFDWRMREERFRPDEAAERGWKSWVELNKH
jgi:sugar phosphate isomerase/epimerase